jgi:adenosylmethionine-8-amino-7-oxononanoate aminotransferase
MNADPTDLEAWDKRHVWHAFTQMAEYEPFIIDHAEGCWLTDIHGNRYLDGVSSLWCNVHGHRRSEIDQAIRKQLDRVAHVTSLGMSNPTTVNLAKRLVDLAPLGLDHVFFSDSGASAVEVALKMAFQYWRQRKNPEPHRTKFIAWSNAYHGDTLGAVSVGGVERFHAMFKPLLFDVLRLPAPDAFRTPSGIPQEQLANHYLADLASLLQQHGHEIAAVVIEPLIQCAAGMLFHPPGFLRGVRELTHKHAVLLIADEVAVGCGRTGTMFACEQESVAPDLLCLGKGLSGGYLPVAATLASTPIFEAFLGNYEESKTFFHGHTFGGNPLGAAAALASLDIFKKDRVLEQLPVKAAHLRESLTSLEEHPYVGEIRQRGLITAIELVQDRATKSAFDWKQRYGHRICKIATERGVWLRPLGDVIVIMPPLSISGSEIDLLGQTLSKAVEDVLPQ